MPSSDGASCRIRALGVWLAWNRSLVSVHMFPESRISRCSFFFLLTSFFVLYDTFVRTYCERLLAGDIACDQLELGILTTNLNVAIVVHRVETSLPVQSTPYASRVYESNRKTKVANKFHLQSFS